MSYTRDNKTSFKSKQLNKMDKQQQQEREQDFLLTDYAVKTAFELMKFKGATVTDEDAFLNVVAKIKKAITPKESLIKKL